MKNEIKYFMSSILNFVVFIIFFSPLILLESHLNIYLWFIVGFLYVKFVYLKLPDKIKLPFKKPELNNKEKLHIESIDLLITIIMILAIPFTSFSLWIKSVFIITFIYFSYQTIKKIKKLNEELKK